MKIKHPKISVLMPVYNAEKFLKEAIDSILNQTFKDFEFLIINDASTDNSKQIILSYQDSRIRYCENKIKLGVAKTLNKGLKMSKGEYIARMDADDISLPERLKKQVEYMNKNQNVGLLGSSWYVIDEAGKKIQFSKAYKGKQSIHFMCHGSVMIRKMCFKKTGFYRDALEPAEDYDLWLRFSEKFEVTNLEKPLYKLRVHWNSVSSTRKEEQALCVALTLKMAKERKKTGQDKLNRVSLQEAKEIRDQWLKSSGVLKRKILAHTNFVWSCAAFKLGDYQKALEYLITAIKTFFKYLTISNFIEFIVRKYFDSYFFKKIYSKYPYFKNKFWDKKAVNIDFLWGRETHDYAVLKTIICKIKPKRLLDVGCGSGRLFPLYGKLKIKEVIGQDISNKALRISAKRYKFLNIKTVNCSNLDLNFPELYFDLIISNRVLQHITPCDIKKVIQKLTELGKYIYINELTNSDELAGTFYMFKHNYQSLFKDHNYIIIKKGRIKKQSWFLFSSKLIS